MAWKNVTYMKYIIKTNKPSCLIQIKEMAPFKCQLVTVCLWGRMHCGGWAALLEALFHQSVAIFSFLGLHCLLSTNVYAK